MERYIVISSNNAGRAGVERYLWPDCMRIIAISSVVLLHAAAPLLYQWNKIPESWWLTANIYDSAVRIGVPLFLLLSGALLLGKNEGYLEFFRKRFSKIAAPFLFWIVVFILWRLFYHNENLNLKSSMVAIATGNVYFHHYFLYHLTGIYLLVPLLRKLRNIKVERYLIILCFFLLSVTPIINKFSNIYIPLVSAPLRFLNFLGYFLVGGMLTSNKINSKYMPLIIIFFFTGLLTTGVGTYILTKKSGMFDEFFYNYGALNVIIHSMSAFILIRYLVAKANIPRRLNKYLARLSQASFGVYFIHLIYLEILFYGTWGFTISGFVLWHPLVAIPITTAATLLLSYASILLLMKVPVVRRFVT